MSRFNFDIGSELASMRGSGNSTAAKKTVEQPIHVPTSNEEPQINTIQGNSDIVVTPPSSQPPAQADSVASQIGLSERATMPLVVEPQVEVQKTHDEILSRDLSLAQQTQGNPIQGNSNAVAIPPSSQALASADTLHSMGLSERAATPLVVEPQVEVQKSHEEIHSRDWSSTQQIQGNPIQGNSDAVAIPLSTRPPAQADTVQPISLSERATTPLVVEPQVEVQKSQDEKLSGAGVSTHKTQSNPVNWKQFKTLPGVFEHVGGDRPVVLNQHIKRVQISGVPEPLLSIIQERLKKRHLGAVIDFPWGSYSIEATNKVFTTKTSLVRYLLFDSLRDEDGTHVQYARQWFLLQYPTSLYADFKPKRDMNASSDELDVYALLAVAHTADPEHSVVSDSRVGLDREAMERLTMLNANIDRVLSKMTTQDQMIQEYAEHNNMIQTVMLLDRMGLLKGGIPRDMGEFIRLLEQNRDLIGQTNDVVDNHIEAEHERKKTLMRDERMRQYNKNRSFT
ncbi:hypothetical protein [Paenibacillus sp. FSL R7-0026]|uniref:hypothetical protein n=1 Tax=Paenibacillus sp. FSL R7-0026 TaxID=2921668 RepID=UPI0030F8422A